MNAQSKDPADHQEEPMPTAATAPEPNSILQDTPASAEASDSQLASSDLPPPIDIGTNDDAKTPPEPDASAPPKGSQRAKTTTKTKTKTKTKDKRAKTKAAGPDKRDAKETGDVGNAEKGTAADEVATITAYLQVPHMELGELSPPTTTLPPQLASLFTGMAAVSVVLAATAAAIGHSVCLAANKDSEDISPALRVAIVGEECGLPPAIAPALEAAYVLEQEEVQLWVGEQQKADLSGAAETARRRLFKQTLSNAALLGLAELPHSLSPTIAGPSSVALPRPRFVLRDPGQKDVRNALEAAEAGVLLVDGRRMATMAGFCTNYDTSTANLLNTAASGRPLELADPRFADCIRMRPITVSVVGRLANVDTFSLHKAASAALAATIFVTAEEESKSGAPATAVKTLTETLQHVRVHCATAQDETRSLRLSAAARKVLELAKARLVRASTEILPPLTDYYAGVADLLTRIVVVLHVLDHAESKADRMSVEVGKEVVLRAVEFLQRSVLPMARITLAVASVAPEVRDARRIISFAQQYASAAFPVLTRRDVIRILQRSMPVAAVDQAIRRLVADGLLTASNPEAAKGGGHVFHISPEIFSPNNQLPDLVSDPRRPRM